MTSSWRLFLAARSTRTALVLGAAVIGVSLLGSDTVLEIRFIAAEPPRRTFPWECLPAVYGALIGALFAPRMHSWERIAIAPLRWYYAALTTTALVLPVLAPWLVHLTLPGRASWHGVLFNVLMITGIGLLATCLLGAVAGPLIALGVYGTVLLTQHAARDVAAILPFSDVVTESDPHVWESLGVAVLAVAAWTVTRGRPRLAHTLQHNAG